MRRARGEATARGRLSPSPLAGEGWGGGKRPDDLQPQPSAERLAQSFGQNRVVNEDVQAVGVRGKEIGEYDGRKGADARQVKPAEDTA